MIEYIKSNDLKAKCARGTFLLGAGTIADRGLAFISKMILVRILMPQEMGLMVLVLSLTMMFEVFTQIGVKQSVIQNPKGDTYEYMNMAWWFQAVRACAIYMIAFALSPWICEFYFSGKSQVMDYHSSSELIMIVRIMFLAIVFIGIMSPGSYVLEKQFKFGKYLMIIQGSAVIGTLITVSLAFILRNVWALVIGFWFTSFLKFIFSFIICPFRPKFQYHKESLIDILIFAKGMLGVPVLAYLALHLDVLVAGKMVSPALVGMYGMALSLVYIPVDLFSRIFVPVLLPAFSEKQNDTETLSKAVLHISKVVLLFAIPAIALLMIYSKQVLTVVFGSRYSEVSTTFTILCVYILLLLNTKIFGNLFFALGKPHLHRKFVGLRVALVLLLIYPAVKNFGLIGVALVLVVANFAGLWIQVNMLRSLISLRITAYLSCWISGLLLTVIVISVTGIMQTVSPSMPLLNMTVGLSCQILLLAIIFRSQNIFLARVEKAETAAKPAGELGSDNV